MSQPTALVGSREKVELKNLLKRFAWMIGSYTGED